MTPHEFLESIDGQLFRFQRVALDYVIDKENPGSNERILLEGLQNMMDELADILHDQYGKDCLFMEESE